MDMTASAPQPVAQPRQAPDRLLVLLSLLSLMMLYGLAERWWVWRSIGPRPRAEVTIDPNTAPWWELAILPRVGPALAHDIVAYREALQRSVPQRPSRPPFRAVQDLDHVKGIGPVTLHRLGPYLRFEDRPRP